MFVMEIIEFAGMPKSGKTTAIEIADSYFKREKKKVRVIYEGARISPLDKDDRFMYNSWSFHNTVNRILEARLDNYDHILIDRGIFDHMAFARAICQDYDLLPVLEYYRIFEGLENRVFLYMLEPEEAIKREKKHNPFLGRVFDSTFLTILFGAYQWVHEEISNENRITLFDGSESLVDNTGKLLQKLKNLEVDKNGRYLS